MIGVEGRISHLYHRANQPAATRVSLIVLLPWRFAFDIARNSTVVDGDEGVWDVMTYCSTRWTSPQRWEWLFDYIGG